MSLTLTPGPRVNRHSGYFHKHGKFKVRAKAVYEQYRNHGKALNQRRIGVNCPICGFTATEDTKRRQREALDALLGLSS